MWRYGALVDMIRVACSLKRLTERIGSTLANQWLDLLSRTHALRVLILKGCDLSADQVGECSDGGV